MDPNSAGAAALHVDRVSLSRGGRVLFRELEFTLQPGERAWMAGRNGTGKSSLARIVAGLLRPTTGAVRAPARVGFAAQEPRFPEACKVRPYLLDLCALGGAGRTRRVAETDEVLDRFELAEHRHQRIGELSRGWKQRLNLARACLGRPQLILLDEPQTALDAEGWEALLRALRAQSAAVLVVGPEESACERIADRKLCLEDFAP